MNMAWRSRAALQRLYLVTPPQLLGDLRDAMTPELRKMVVGELNKDLTIGGRARLTGSPRPPATRIGRAELLVGRTL